MSEIVIRFQKARLNTGLSQSEIAEKMGISLRTYQRVEANPENLSITEMKRYMSIFGISIDEMLLGNGEMLLNEQKEPQKQNEQTEEEQELLANFKALPPDLQSIYMKEIELEALKEARKKRQNNITAPTAKSKSSIA